MVFGLCLPRSAGQIENKVISKLTLGVQISGKPNLCNTAIRWAEGRQETLAEVTPASATDNFISYHIIACVAANGNCRIIHRFVKTRPSCAGIEFRIGSKKFLLTAREVR